jgi:hypothetical protein
MNTLNVAGRCVNVGIPAISGSAPAIARDASALRGYVLGVMLAAMQPRRRVGTLVVTAAAALVLGSASTALAQTSGGEAQSTPARAADLLPDASWHGRAIKRPDAQPLQVEPADVAAVQIRQGAGYGRPEGSPVVRDVQRRLRALGYRCGHVDGMFGPRTRSSVAWFQIKHRLAPTGVVDGATLNVLRFRTHGVPSATAPTVTARVSPDAGPAAPQPDRAHPAGAAPVEPKPDPAPAQPSPGALDGRQAGVPVLLLAFAVVLALMFVTTLVKRPAWPEMATTRLQTMALAQRPRLTTLVRRRRLPALPRIPSPPRVRRPKFATTLPKPPRMAAGLLPARRRATRTRVSRVPARPPASTRGRSSGAVAAKPPMPSPAAAGGRRVIGYAVGRDASDFARQRRAMERVCAERGWTLASLVKERPGSSPRSRRRPGLTHGLKQLAAGRAAHLVVCRLEHLAPSPAELGALLEWCRTRDVGVVALDVDLDTSTADGLLAARCLGAVGVPTQVRPPAPASNGRANGNGRQRTREVR